MGRKIAGDCNEDVPALVTVAPRGGLADSRLQHLIGMEACIFAQQCTRERSDQRLRRMAEREMPRHQSRRKIDLSLAVEGVEQGGADHPRIGRQLDELLAALARDERRRHIEIASKIERHRAVQYAAHGRAVTVGTGGPDPLEHLVDRIGVVKTWCAVSQSACSLALPKRATRSAAA